MDWSKVAYQAAVTANHPDPQMFVRQMMAESGLNPNAQSPAGAVGIAQIMPATAKGWGVNPHDPVASLNAAAHAMSKYIHQYGDAGMALAAYNAGVGAVNKYRGIPPYAETRAYVNKILGGHGMPQGVQGPQSGVQAPQSAGYDPVTLGNQANKIAIAYAKTPEVGQAHINNLYDRLGGGGLVEGPQTPNARAQVGDVPSRRPGETGQQYLDRILMGKFGLRHDPGNGQTTGGRHMAGSDHYRGTATDFGNVLNTPAQLQQAENYLEANADKIGLKQALYGESEAEGHGNHLHGSTWKSITGPKGPPVNTSTGKSKRRRPARKDRVSNASGNPYQQ